MITMKARETIMKLDKDVNNLKKILRVLNKMEKDALLAKHRSVPRDKAIIDINTGEILFARQNLILNPGLLCNDLESYPDVMMPADTSEQKSCWRTYKLTGHYLVERMKFEISIACKDDRIKEVWLRNARLDFQVYGSYWSEKKQFERIRVHEKWLERVFGNKRANDFHWGRIASCYNPVVGISYIAIQYK